MKSILAALTILLTLAPLSVVNGAESALSRVETLGRADDSDDAGPFAVITETAPGKLILKRAQNSGKLTVTATMSNGCKPVTQSVTSR